MARIFGEAFTKPGYSMEDFLDHTYGTVRRSSFVFFVRALRILQLIDTEVKRKIKKEPALAMELRKDLFPESDAPEMDAGVSGRDAVSELWVFA
jgi:U3 small nucleolar RNA-associated protein 19